MIKNKSPYKNSFLFTLLAFTCIAFSCCTPEVDCDPPRSTVYSLSEKDTQNIPYSGEETLVFKINNSEVIELKGKGKRDFYNVIALNGGNPDCDPSTNSFQNYEYVHATLDNVWNVRQTYNVNTLNSLLTITVNNNAFIGTIAFANDSSDSVMLNNVIYKGVTLYKYIRDINGNYTIDSTSFVFFSAKNKGILKINLDNTQVLDRVL